MAGRKPLTLQTESRIYPKTLNFRCIFALGWGLESFSLVSSMQFSNKICLIRFFYCIFYISVHLYFNKKLSFSYFSNRSFHSISTIEILNLIAIFQVYKNSFPLVFGYFALIFPYCHFKKKYIRRLISSN